MPIGNTPSSSEIAVLIKSSLGIEDIEVSDTDAQAAAEEALSDQQTEGAEQPNNEPI